MSASSSTDHDFQIQDQFSRQAEIFAALPELHGAAALDLLVDAADPQPSDTSLDVACGPGSVACAFARRVARAVGLDATEAMLDQARAAAAAQGLANVEWRRGDVYALPFEDGAFDIVSCRFAVHHFQEPVRAVREMVRVCRPGGRVVICDAMASDDPEKAAAFNAMERFRDPSTATFLTLAGLRALFAEVGLPEPSERFYALRAEREGLIAASFPENDDRAGLRALIDASVDGDRLGMNARWKGETVLLSYPSVVLAAAKPN